MTILSLILYLIIGLVAGLSSGLLGIGGGIIVVPCLALIFHAMDLPTTYLMQVAVGTSLGAMIFTAGSSAWAHYLKKGVNWRLVQLLSPGLGLGSILGAIIAVHLPSRQLEIFFGLFECLIGGYFLLSPHGLDKDEFKSLSWLLATIIGVLVGGISTILGVGGGIITMPVLTFFGVPIRSSISTSAVTGFLIALIGAVSFLYSGLGIETFEGTLGYLYLPAFIPIGIAASLMAPYGAKLAYLLPTHILKKIFGIVLILVGVIMIYG